MAKPQTYTHTEEGKYILSVLSNIISTSGMEVYQCGTCGELFGGQPHLAVRDGKPECGLCQSEREAILRSEYPNEVDYPEDEE